MDSFLLIYILRLYEKKPIYVGEKFINDFWNWEHHAPMRGKAKTTRL